MTFQKKVTYDFIRAGIWLSALILTLQANATQSHSLTTVTNTQAQQNLSQQKQGVPVAALLKGAPNSYTVKKSDTLWGISALYLQKPWLWPQLWRMNTQQIKNPHLIYPGQMLSLDVHAGYANLTLADAGTVRLSPHAREQTIAQAALPTIRLEEIEPFLVSPVIRDIQKVKQFPSIVAAQDERLIIAAGDKIYACGSDQYPLSISDEKTLEYSIFRQAKPLRDPKTHEVLGYEGEYIGRVWLERGEYFVDDEKASGQNQNLPDKRNSEQYRPATLVVRDSVSEIRLGDQLDAIAEQELNRRHFIPHLPPKGTIGLVASLYADQAVSNAVSHNVVTINLGKREKIEPGHVFQILKKGMKVKDPQESVRRKIQLPDESNGFLLIFRVFDRLSYGLILGSTDPVGVGDKLIVPE